jgi:hypothetical protein
VRHAEPKQHKASSPTSAPTPTALQSRQINRPWNDGRRDTASWKVARDRARSISVTSGTMSRLSIADTLCARLICRRRARVDIESDETRRFAPSNEQRCDVRRA